MAKIEKETDQLNAAHFIECLQMFASADDSKSASRYFKTGKGEYGEGDIFLGVRNGPVNALSKEFIEMPLKEVEKLLRNPIHEARSGALGIMDLQARKKKTPEDRRKELYDLYLKNLKHINNWDLVDKSAPSVIGGFLLDKDKAPLFKMTKSENVWERRTAMVSTQHLIRNKLLDTTFELALELLNDKHDLIHKAVGWMLREAGERDKTRLMGFLENFAAVMPRTALRYAIEHFDASEKAYFMAFGKTKK